MNQPAGPAGEAGDDGYVELAVTTAFSFLRGASLPEELVARAAGLGQPAIAIADRNSVAGAPRAHIACREAGIRLVAGARLDFTDGPGTPGATGAAGPGDGPGGASLLCFPEDRAAWGRLTRLLTLGRRRAPKGQCHLALADLGDAAAGQLLVALPPEQPGADFARHLEVLRDFAGDRLYLAGRAWLDGRDRRRLDALGELSAAAGVPLVATNDVHYHDPARRPLQDVMTCIREHCTIHEAGRRLFANAERHLKSAAAMRQLFVAWPEAVARSREIAGRAGFSLDNLRYEYPVDVVPDGRTAQAELERLAWRGAAARWPGGVPAKVRQTVEHELALIDELDYAAYFLTVHDIVRFARERGILCQGRGSAANSAVCYCLGITAVDPSRLDLLFERFVSAERGEPPDIDVDFEHERREEVIGYVYERYGRHRAGLAATTITYRAKSALRETGRAMGLSEDAIQALAGAGHGRDGIRDERIREAGLDPEDRTVATTLALARALTGMPRHLSQHPGGFVITRGPLEDIVPVENAAMAGRTVIQWNKDDLDTLGILKIDLLGLGMLTCIRKGFGLIARHHGRRFELATVPAEDPAVYDMLCRADSIGVFQVESRAQMSMLPRLRPRAFYDLVIEVAIVRPGPIQGDMVHPYLRRRNGEEPVDYPSAALREVLGRTLGVPLFQEQAMRIAIVAAGFTPSEADRLRRAMATFRNSGQISGFRDKMIRGMLERGYDRNFAERCFRQIEGFGEYGFPESHAASFALLVYVSAWMKCRWPAVFACALLNSQPMGFYAPAQIVRDAREHGVRVRPVDVGYSERDCSLEPDGDGGGNNGGVALRLGLRQVKGFSDHDADRLVAARGNGWAGFGALWRRAGLAPRALERLADANAFVSLGLGRREALWAIRGAGPAPLPLFAAMGEDERGPEPPVALPAPAPGEAMAADYASLRLTLDSHPLALLRAELERDRPCPTPVMPAARLVDLPPGIRVSVAGLVLVRQRPGTAKGVIFMTLEDETGIANIIVWPQVFERFRRQVVGARLAAVTGRLQREGMVIHVIAGQVVDLSARLDRLATGETPGPEVPGKTRRAGGFGSRDFH